MTETKETRDRPVVWNVRRLAALALCIGTAVPYLPLNRVLTGGTTVETIVDRYIPFWPIWIVPYLMTIIWWLAAGVWAALRMENRIVETLAVRWVSACLIGMSIFVLFPTYMIRPQATGDDWATHLVETIYANDRTYNAFPSMHLWVTATISLTWNDWRPRWRWLWWSIIVIVALSTMFTGQHWFLDWVGGTALAIVCYYAGPALFGWLVPGWRHPSEPARCQARCG